MEYNLNTIKLSAAIVLIDSLTQSKNIIGDIRFALNSKQYSPVVKQEEYFIFINLFTGKYQVKVDASFYFPLDEEIQVNNQLTVNNLLYTWVLTPRPNYPFPIETTLVQGQVLDKNSNAPIGRVKIVAAYSTIHGIKTVETITDDQGNYNGCYALVCTDLASNSENAELTFSKVGYQEVKINLEVKKNYSNLLNQSLEPITKFSKIKAVFRR